MNILPLNWLRFLTAAWASAILACAQTPAPPKAEPLPALGPGFRVLFQGDSITDGNRGRSADPNHILGHGYAFIIAAKYGAAFPELNLTFMNRGVSGNKVTDLAARWQKETLDLKPDLLSILIGVNDASVSMPLDQFESVYDRLLTETKQANPSIKLILGEPFTLPYERNKANWDKWSEDLRARREIVAKLARKHGAAVALFQKVFDDACKRAKPEYWIWDGVHPTYSGHQLMAEEWERAAREFWPVKPAK